MQVEIVKLRIISGAARGFLGWMAGNSMIDLKLTLIDSDTNNVIANPTIPANSAGAGASWVIRNSERRLLEYLAYVVNQYMVDNY